VKRPGSRTHEHRNELAAIEGELSIYRAAELRDLLTPHWRSPDLEMNLAAVTEMDSAGVQLLMAAKKSAAPGARALRLVNHSPAVLEVFELLDLAAHFGDPLLIRPRRNEPAAGPLPRGEAHES
jgi:anti-sigma B factor antagonist